MHVRKYLQFSVVLLFLFPKIYKVEGIKGFYYGLSPSLVGNGFSWATCFFMYGINCFIRNNRLHRYRYIQGGPQHNEISFTNQMLAASAAGTSSLRSLWHLFTSLQEFWPQLQQIQHWLSRTDYRFKPALHTAHIVTKIQWVIKNEVSKLKLLI